MMRAKSKSRKGLKLHVQINLSKKQAEKLKSHEMKEGWMKNDEGWMKNDEGWMINELGWWFQAIEGFCRQMNEWMNRRTDK